MQFENSAYWEDLYRDPEKCITGDYDGWLEDDLNKIPAGSLVLDLGCGSGPNIPAMLARGLKVTAADYSIHAVRGVQAAYRDVQTLCFDMRNGCPFQDAAFTAVIADLSLHYFNWTDTRRIAGEIRRILKGDGILIARVHSTANFQAGEEIEPGYYISEGFPRRYFSMEDVKTLFGEWTECRFEEKTIRRYGMQKEIIEIHAKKPV